MIIFKHLIFLFIICQCVNFNHTKTFGQKKYVESSFSPPSVSSTGRATYKVVIHGTQQNPQGSLPQVSGLRISNTRQTLRTANFNGVPLVRVELSFQVQAERVGSFTIPSWPLTVEGQKLIVPPATLQVLPPNQKEKQAQADLRQAAFLELKLPKDYFYEGETIMSSLTLFIWDRLPVNRIENVPTKIGESFSSNKLGKWADEKRNVSKYGKLYSSFTWPVSLTAAMAGIKDISYEVNLRVRVNSRRNSPFTSPFFNDPFFGFGREESLTVTLPTKSIEVKPLPYSNKPVGFSGAIGNFSTKTRIDSDQVEVGDPVRLNFSLQGQGNFAAIPAPELLSNKEFKVGPPAFLFEGNQETKFEGKQNFEFIITPLKEGSLDLPSIMFSFFDPYKERYETIEGQNLKLQVNPGKKWELPPSTSSSEAQINMQNPSSPGDLFQTASDPGEWTTSLKRTPVDKNSWFWVIQLIPFFTVATFLILGWKKRNSLKEDFRIKKANLSRKLNESTEHRDGVQFFRAFKDLLRMQINKMDKSRNSFALSSDELTKFIKERDLGEKVTGEIEEILRLGDDLEFAEGNSNELDFKNLKSRVSEILKKVS